MKQLLLDLRAECEKATQGEWAVGYKDGSGLYDEENEKFCISCDDNLLFHARYSENKNDCEYITLASPQNILLILDAMDKMREALEFYSSQIVPKIELYTTPIFLEDGKNKIGHRASQTLKEVFGNE